MRKQNRIHSLITVFCCAVMALFVPHAQAEEGERVESSARAAILIERNTGTVLLQHNAQEALPMASTTKVMTALMALEYGKLDEVVTVGRNAYGVPGTSIYLSLGEQITLRDLLYGLMLSSGNDAAVAIAEHIGGNTENFCRMMTQRAAELGCMNTVFVNPHGLPVHGHHTTAYDLALIAREAMKHNLFRQIVSTQRASIPWEGRSYSRILNNKNKLLVSYEGATGIKTGYTKAAGRCLVFGAQRAGMEVIGVVLNCSDWFDEAARLMDLGFGQYEMFRALDEGQILRAIPVENGVQETVSVRSSAALEMPVRKGCIPALEVEMPDEAEAGHAEGEIIGEARLVLDGKARASVSLELGESLPVRDFSFEIQQIGFHWLSMPQMSIEK